MVAAVMVCAELLVSFVPITIANRHYTGTWLPLEFAGVGNLKLDPFWGIIGNAIAIPAQNLLPPFYNLLPPFYTDWGRIASALRANFLHSAGGAHFDSFENFLLLSHGHGITDENTGMGLGISLVLIVAVGEAWRHRKNEVPVRSSRHLKLLRWIPWGLLLIFMAKVGSYQKCASPGSVLPVPPAVAAGPAGAQPAGPPTSLAATGSDSHGPDRHHDHHVGGPALVSGPTPFWMAQGQISCIGCHGG